MRPQELIFGLSGQTLYYDAPETTRPSAPSVQVWLATNDDTTGVELATTGSASVDSVSTTIATTAVTAGVRSFTVALGTGIARNRRYLLTDAGGNCEMVEVLSINGTTVGVRNRIANDYAIGSTFQGCRISISIDNTWAANAGKLTDSLSGSWRTDRPSQTDDFVGQAGYRARWAYTTNGATTVGYSFFDLVRYQAKNLVTPLDVDNRFPGWIDRLDPDHIQDQGASIVLEAFYAVKMDAMADALMLRKVRNTEILRELVVHRANILLIEDQVMTGSGPANLDSLKVARDVYTQRYDTLVREPKFPTDASGGGASAQAPRLPLTRR